MMKIFVAFAIFIVGLSAHPKLHISEADLKNERFVDDLVASAIQDLSQSIREAGLDPLHIPNGVENIALPVPVIFSASAVVDELLFNGLSNIVINNINFGLLTLRLTFDIELPRIQLSTNNAKVDVVVFGSDFSASAAGRLAITRIRVRGEARISIGIISGVSVNSLSIDFSLGGVESLLNIAVQNTNYSNQVNTFLGTTIPATLAAYSSEMNELIEIIALDLIGDLL